MSQLGWARALHTEGLGVSQGGRVRIYFTFLFAPSCGGSGAAREGKSLGTRLSLV